MSKSEISVPLKIENNDCLMQLDTGCALSLAPLSFIKDVCPVCLGNLHRWNCAFLRGSICECWIFRITVLIALAYCMWRIMCFIWSKLAHGCQLRLKKPARVESHWPLAFTFTSVPSSTGNQTLDYVLEQYSELFQTQLGCYTGTPVVLNESREANFHKATILDKTCWDKLDFWTL